MNREEYNAYLRSDHWKRIKARRSGGKDNMRCQICKSKENINLHHKTYKRLWKERMNDLVWLCRNCHAMVHEKTRFNKELTIMDIKFDYLLTPVNKSGININNKRKDKTPPPVIGANGRPVNDSSFRFYKQRKLLSVENTQATVK